MKPKTRVPRLILVTGMLVFAVVSPIPHALVAEGQGDGEAARETLASVDLTLPAGDVSWLGVVRDTVTDNEPMTDYPPGVLIALDDPLLLLRDGETGIERLQADSALALSAPVSARTVSMMTETPVKYLTVEVTSIVADEDAESVPFEIAAGAYTMSVWRVDTAEEVPRDVAVALDSLRNPSLVFVRSGSIEVAAVVAGESPRHLEGGEWAVVSPDAVVTTASGSEPPVVVFVTLERPEEDAVTRSGSAQPGTGPSVPPSGQGQVVPGGPSVGPTVVPTIAPTDVPVIDPTAEPTVPTTTDPGSGQGGIDTNGVEEDGGLVDEIEPGFEEDGGLIPDEEPIDQNGVEEDGGLIPDEQPIDVNGVQEDGGVLNGGGVLNTGVVIQEHVSCTMSLGDRDRDGLSDACEGELGTKPYTSDSDGDGLGDGDEVNVYKTNPTTMDTDSDDLSDGNEVNTYGTSPIRFDHDGDGLGDGFDLGAGTDPLDSDFDDDRLLDGEEMNFYGTYPKIYDSDGDGLGDGDEVLTHGSNPLVEDTDNDCFGDGVEVLDYGTSPTVDDGDRCTF